MNDAMAKAVQRLPDDVDALKALVASRDDIIAAKDNHIALLEEKLRLASQKRFGASSEKVGDDQLGLFNEAEQTVSDATPQEPADAEGIVGKRSIFDKSDWA